MATPPSTPPMNIIMEALKAEFELTDEQFAALPPLSEVDLVPQSDSQLIEHTTLATYTYHPYKLFIGEHKNDPFHAYLYRTGGRKQYQIELCSVDADNGSHYPPIDATYYGTVHNLAYPYNTFLGTARFVAVVKWYFFIGLRAGLFDEDPGFSLTASWRRELQGACNELITATEREEKEKQREEEKRFEEKRRAEERKQNESVEAVKQATGSRKANATPKPRTKPGKHMERSPPRKDPAATMGYDGHNDTEDRRLERPLLHRSSQPPRAAVQYDHSPIRPLFNTMGAYWDALRPPISHGPPSSSWSPPGGTQPPHDRRYRKETSLPHPQPPMGDPRGPEGMRTTGAIIMPAPTGPFPIVKTRGERRREDEEAAKRKSRSIRESIVATNEALGRKEQGKRATKDSRLEAFDGSTDDHNHDRPTVPKQPWMKNVKRSEASNEDRVAETESTHGRENDSFATVPLATEYKKLFKQRKKIQARMDAIKDELSEEEAWALFKDLGTHSW